ncbi:MAG: MG2 domain-containing protein [Bacteroidota bacterium]
MMYQNSKTPFSLTYVKAVFLFLFASLVFTTCKQQGPGSGVTTIDPEFTSYIYAYTSGIISKTEPILIRFVDPVITEDEIGTLAEDGLITFSPSIKGTAIWEDTRTLKFEQEDYLNSGTNYLGKVKVNKLFEDVPSKLNQFNFDFRTREMFYTVDFEGLRTADIGDLKNQSYKGIIKTTDYADPEKVENILSANQKGNKNLNILWEHGPDQLIHRFTVENIKRGDAVSSLKLNWNGNTLGVKKKGDTDIEIPMLGDFKVTDVKVMQSEEPFILINFSDPLRQNQNLNGLIRIKSYNSDIRFNIDGNQVRMYPSRRVNGEREILFSNGIVNIENYKMKDPGNWKVNFESQKPQLRLVGKGVILPNSKGLVFPFEAVSLNAVDVEIFKIYENNILQFLQYNELSSNYELERVGKVILQKKINLSDLDPEANAHNWTRYAFDLSDLVEKDPQAIYQVRIGFKKSYATFTCEENEASDFFASIEQQEGNNLDEYGDIKSIWDESYRYWSYTNYRWNHRENPCYPPYYRPHNFVRRNVVASDLGIVAKRGDDGTIFAAVSNLTSTAMMPGTTIELYNFQQQLIDKVTTDGKGMASIKLKKKPSFLIAKKDDQRGYLKLDDGSSLSLSRFDVAGSRAQKGLKGYIYADRGVWRPGDSIYINFILEDKTAKLPPNHPVTFEFYDPKGQLQEKMTTSKHVNKVYSFYTATDRESPTGNWYAKVKIGGATFEKTFKIETVKPNRLKIKIDFGKEELAADDQSINGDLQVNWLHGAPGKNLKAQVDIQLKTTPTKFNKYSDFVFDDPARRFSTEPFTIFDGQVNDKGSATVKGDLATNTFPPGKLAVNFRTRAFEKGGDFSSDAFTMPYSPYQNYVGLFIKKDKWGSKRLNLDKDNEVEIVVVDKDGNPVANKNLNMGLYRIQWRWWWERSQDRITNFNSATHTGAVETEKATTNSKGEATWNFTPERWGRYMIRICDETSGHCTGDMFYAGYPWYDDEDSGSRDGASMLVFNSDKKAYDVGETVELNIPTSGAGRALISIENGSKVVESYWTDVSKGETKFRFYATEEMTPTVYANVTLIQPHAQNQNDLPIRMYGVIPIKVEDPATKLQPEIKMADVLRPEEKVTIEVKESSGKPMAYTIAMVDEGLLDLTRFRTPDPWNKFYAREALGVKTWDVYDQVLGAYGGELERILSIGGDEAVNPEGPKKANRFKPVVHHIGPFFLEKGKKAKHELMMPNYVGSVRTMVVAADKGAYGNAEKTTPVKKPLMVLATLPRVLGPGETVRLPVNVFAMEDKVKNVKVSVETSPLLELIGPSTKNIQFNTVGDQIVNFEYRVKEGIGLAEVKITATGAGETATQEIELDVRNPNPHVTEVINKVLEPGSTWDTNIRPVGMAGTNSGILEVSNVPPINLGERLNWLIRYPHGCIEQTTSSGFPQLFVNKLIEIEDNKKKEI